MNAARLGLLIVLAICIGASGLLSGSETALVTIPRERLPQLSVGSRKAKLLAVLAADRDRMLGTLLVANNFVNILAASIATVLAIDLISISWGEPAGETWGPWVATLATTAVILVVGEITPKSLAARHPEAYALRVTPFVWRLSVFLAPVARVFVSISRNILRVFGADEGTERPVTEGDIRALVGLSADSGEIDAAEREIIESLFPLADRTVREVMTPRVEMRTLHLPLTEHQARTAVAETGHSRFPVVEKEGELDRLLGVLYAKDLFGPGPSLDPARIERLIREPHYVPESASILAVLHRLRHERIGFAIVVDEHGGVEGVVTVKDLVSELVGELHDEYDRGAPVLVARGLGHWDVEGKLPAEDLARATGVDLPEGPFSTVAGLYMFAAGRIPSEGDSIEIEGLWLKVLKMDRRRIDRLRAELTDQGSAPTDAG